MRTVRPRSPRVVTLRRTAGRPCPIASGRIGSPSPHSWCSLRTTTGETRWCSTPSPHRRFFCWSGGGSPTLASAANFTQRSSNSVVLPGPATRCTSFVHPWMDRMRESPKRRRCRSITVNGNPSLRGCASNTARAGWSATASTSAPRNRTPIAQRSAPPSLEVRTDAVRGVGGRRAGRVRCAGSETVLR